MPWPTTFTSDRPPPVHHQSTDTAALIAPEAQLAARPQPQPGLPFSCKSVTTQGLPIHNWPSFRHQSTPTVLSQASSGNQSAVRPFLFTHPRHPICIGTDGCRQQPAAQKLLLESMRPCSAGIESPSLIASIPEKNHRRWCQVCTRYIAQHATTGRCERERKKNRILHLPSIHKMFHLPERPVVLIYRSINSGLLAPLGTAAVNDAVARPSE
ncbi:uncharacterized protein BDZ83DRAFT_463241 [Colletotrichum acutatum]|uniref:Uncharacterized protein n=1 Tax=Glomerella acutata TaxID=27357 RepID=A0AAD8UGT5_GLOAC|nr:uncharacterized protein BDZ83DRAFT_463241 [Colletotrichum acutatum]KAK1719310.1 hypothetical protein BDZ83DRAFT_463241 [Colletotrichum acutatum]